MLLSFCICSTTLTAEASNLPSYSTDDDGNIVVDGEFTEEGEKVTFNYPVSVDEYEGNLDGSNNDNFVSDEEISLDTSETSPDLLEGSETSDSLFSSYDSPTSIAFSASNALSVDFRPDNCIRYSTTYNGSDCFLLIPASYYDSVYIDGNGVLWNVGNNTITGRLLFRDSISDSDYDSYWIVINSCIGSTNSPSVMFSGGSLTEIRHYYLESGRIRYTSSYGAISINGDTSNYSRNLDANFKLIGTIVIALLMIGGFLCLRKRSNTL